MRTVRWKKELELIRQVSEILGLRVFFTKRGFYSAANSYIDGGHIDGFCYMKLQWGGEAKHGAEMGITPVIMGDGRIGGKCRLILNPEVWANANEAERTQIIIHEVCHAALVLKFRRVPKGSFYDDDIHAIAFLEAEVTWRNGEYKDWRGHGPDFEALMGLCGCSGEPYHRVLPLKNKAYCDCDDPCPAEVLWKKYRGKRVHYVSDEERVEIEEDPEAWTCNICGAFLKLGYIFEECDDGSL